MNVMTQYQIKTERIDEHLAAIAEFVEQLKQLNNADIKFTAYQLPDEVSFRHITYLKDNDTAEALMSQDFYKALGDGTLERCEQQPEFTPMDMVATFKI